MCILLCMYTNSLVSLFDLVGHTIFLTQHVLGQLRLLFHIVLQELDGARQNEVELVVFGDALTLVQHEITLIKGLYMAILEHFEEEWSGEYHVLFTWLRLFLLRNF